MDKQYGESLEKLAQNGRLRELKPLSGRNGCRVEYNGSEMLNLTSNDYLGIAGDRLLHRKFYDLLSSENIVDNYGLGSASSRLLTGDSANAQRLEQRLCAQYNKESCLLYNSGYHANIGVLPALLGKNDLILSDKLNHASIMDGMRLCKAKFKRYRHCDYAHLKSLLHEYRSGYQRVIIVSESVFSMDGDVADITQLVELKKEFNCQLYIDEAHGIGLYGQNGLGMAEQLGQLQEVDILMGTFGKALASIGAFVLCSETIKKYLINHSRSLIFTTALPPVVLFWNHYIFKKMVAMHEQRKHLHDISLRLRKSLTEKALKTAGTTNIVPVMIGDDSLAVLLAGKMQEKGYLIFPVRPPAVPEGTARFRLSLTADMEWCDIKSVAKDIATLF